MEAEAVLLLQNVDQDGSEAERDGDEARARPDTGYNLEIAVRIMPAAAAVGGINGRHIASVLCIIACDKL